jgi:hypothetical protein
VRTVSQERRWDKTDQPTCFVLSILGAGATSANVGDFRGNTVAPRSVNGERSVWLSRPLEVWIRSIALERASTFLRGGTARVE